MRTRLALVAIALALTACSPKGENGKPDENKPVDVTTLDKAALETLAGTGDTAAKDEVEKRKRAEQKAAFDAAVAGNDEDALDKLADAGNGFALHRRAERLLASQFPSEQQAGYVDMEAAADAGNADAQLWVGEKMAYGTNGYPWKPNSGLMMMERAARQGHVKAMFTLGVFYSQDQPMQDQEKSRQWFEKAAAAGSKEAQDALEELKKMQAPPT